MAFFLSFLNNLCISLLFDETYNIYGNLMNVFTNYSPSEVVIPLLHELYFSSIIERPGLEKKRFFFTKKNARFFWKKPMFFFFLSPG